MPTYHQRPTRSRARSSSPRRHYQPSSPNLVQSRGTTSRGQTPSPRRRNSRNQQTGDEMVIGLDAVHDHLAMATNRSINPTIAPFDGSAEIDIDDWLLDFEDFAVGRGWNDQLKKEQLPNLLVGTAKFWCMNRRAYPETSPDESVRRDQHSLHLFPWRSLTWSEVKTEFRSHYLPRDHRRHLYQRLGVAQKPGEDIVAFFDQKVHIGIRLNKSPTQIIEAIQSSLLPEYRRLLATQDFVNLKDFLQKLKEIDLVIKETQTIQNRQMELEKYKEENARLKKQLKEGNTTRTRNPNTSANTRERRCYICGTPGHTARSCRSPQFMRRLENRNYGTSAGVNIRQDRVTNHGNPNYGPPSQDARNQSFHNPRDQFPANRYGYNQSNYPNQNRLNQGSTNNYYRANHQQAIEGPRGNETQTKQNNTRRINKVELASSLPEFKLIMKLNGKSVEGMLDTGASRSCLDYEFYRRVLSDQVDLLVARDLAVIAAGDITLQVEGIANVTYEYLDKQGTKQQIMIPTIVINRLGTTLIIGRDFISASKLILDTTSNTIYCDKPVITKPKEMTNLVFGQEQVVVPPKSTVIMSVKVDTLTPDCGVVTTVDMSENSLKGKVVVANSLVETTDEDENLLIPVTNFGDDKQLIDEGTVVGQFEPYAITADDLNDDHENSYVFMEKTEKLNIGQGEVNIGVDLTVDDKQQLSELLHEFEHLFAFDGKLGECTVLEHQIDTGDNKPIHSAPYRQSYKVRESIQKQIRDWLDAGVIRPSSSPWSSPVVIVPKKDKSMRMCIDLRGVNKLTKKDVYPLPNLEDTLASLNRAMYFSSLDLNQGYMQIKMAKDSIPKTAFVTQDGLYEFTRMPFGLTNAPATFQRCMDIVLSGLKWNQCLVYLDDVIIFGKDLNEHNQNLVNVFNRIQNANLTIKPSKCAFAVQELRFLGHVVSGQGIRMDPQKIGSIKDLPSPTNVTEIRSFIGAASYYRRFVKDFSKIAEPLTRLTKDKVEFKWTEEQQEAFEKIKQCLITQPVLCHYNPALPIELRTDACGYGLGAILLHEYPDKTKRVIAYASRLLQNAEKNYAITEQECLAIVWAIDKFKTYLQGTKFTVVTDHLALTWLKEKKQLTGRLMRWSLMLQTYDYEVVYKSGKHHKDADHLSRYPVINRISYGRRGTRQQLEDNENIDVQDTQSLEMEINRSEAPRFDEEILREAQATDEFCQQIRNNLEHNPNFENMDGILVENNPHNRSYGPRAVIPESIFDRVMYAVHDDPMSGHCGFRKTLWKFQQRYYIQHATRKVKKYVQTCHLCQTRKTPWTRRYGAMQPLQLVTRPFERIGIDTLGPFRRSNNGLEKIIVVTDYMTKWAIAKAIPRENATEIANMLIERVFLQYGVPEVILSDRGQSFRTELMREIYQEFNTRHVTTTAYHPQTNGLTERFNKTLATMLSMYVSEHHRDWHTYLPYVVFAYNTTIQDSTGYSPFYLLHGIQARLWVDIMDSNPEIPNTERFERLHEDRELAIAANRLAQGRQKQQYDKNRYIQEFNPGDLVLVYRTRGYTGQTTKLRHPYEGPFRVIQRNSDLVYLLQNLNSRLRRPREELVHVSRMKPYYLRPNNGLQDTSQDNGHNENNQTALTENLRTVTGSISWIKTFFHYLMILNVVFARVVWRPTNFKLQIGMQDVIVYTHYELPCNQNGTMFNHPEGRRKANVTTEFEFWCWKFTRETVNRALTQFCDDSGTANPYHPIMKYASRRQERRLAKTKKKRDKREIITLVCIAIGAVVAFGGTYIYRKMTETDQSNVEEVAKSNLENVKKISVEIDEINKRIDYLFGTMNTTILQQKEIVDQINTLNMQSNFENQAIVASVVSSFQNIERDLREIADDWKQGKINRKLFRLFGYEDKCLTSTCPADQHIPLKCKFHAIDQNVELTMRRRMIRDDVEIVKADPFTYFKIQKKANGTYVDFQLEDWKSRKNEMLSVCKSTYVQTTHFALSKHGCVSYVVPNEPTYNDIPVITGVCFNEAWMKNKSRRDSAYSEWSCQLMLDKFFDGQSVQIKVENDQLLVYCPYNQIRINDGDLRDCPLNEILSMAYNNNVTIYQHASRPNPRVIVEYDYSAHIERVRTKFDMPDNFRLIKPDHEMNKTLIEDLEKEITVARGELDKHRKGVRWEFPQYVRKHKGSIIWGVLGGMIIAAMGILVFIGLRKIFSRKPKPSAPSIKPYDSQHQIVSYQSEASDSESNVEISRDIEVRKPYKHQPRIKFVSNIEEYNRRVRN